jgi:hypothetical protein
MNVLKRAWILLLVVIVVAVAGFTVYPRACSVRLGQRTPQCRRRSRERRQAVQPQTGDL